MPTFTNQTALITGGGTGIGRGIALALGAEGASVAVCGRTREPLEESADLIRTHGVEAAAIQADITQEEEVAKLIREIESELGPISILVNNAGVARFASVWELTPEEFDEMVAVNLRGTFLCSRAVIPGMIERGQGRILNIASVAGLKPYPTQGGYCASKHAQIGLAKVMGIELQEHGIVVQTISPGGVDTPLARGIRDDVDFNDWMTVEEVAEAAMFMLSQQGRATTDHLILRRGKATAWSNASA
ncbi:MAG: SDR family oxidoreductase [Planctomycetota bacterium]|jgi:3-oxoacyl-[acyl-carrier protein] reductase|nr:SDR family oxidoreductase [Planctomycetota bacterium]MDP7131734.1 SDR family oxidoreductase [Planctomycetota bacterium]MDP7249868.1 SDR family oxidoreductase [Planctomycetota bacterium]